MIDSQNSRSATRVFGGLLLSCAFFWLTGCSSSTDKSPAAAADDIRGEPINSPVSNATQAAQTPAASPLVADLKSQPDQSATATNAASAKNLEEPLNAKAGEFLPVGFEKLASFVFEMPDESNGTNQLAGWKTKDQIPPSVKALDQKSVAIKGFMLPLKVESGLVTEMLIMRDQSMCCYGTVPKINEWVSVKMLDKGVKAIMDQPVTIFGKLRVGEMRENGYLVGLYQLDGQKMSGPADL